MHCIDEICILGDLFLSQQEIMSLFLRDQGKELGIIYHLNVPHTLSLNTLVKRKVLSKAVASLLSWIAFKEKEKKKKEKLIKEGTFYMFHITFVC